MGMPTSVLMVTFPGEKDRSNILVTLADKQRFCGYGHIKPNYNGDGASFDPESGVPLDGEKGPLAFMVLLQDTNGKYCKGYISASLVSTVQ